MLVGLRVKRDTYLYSLVPKLSTGALFMNALGPALFLAMDIFLLVTTSSMIPSGFPDLASSIVHHERQWSAERTQGCRRTGDSSMMEIPERFPIPAVSGAFRTAPTVFLSSCQGHIGPLCISNTSCISQAAITVLPPMGQYGSPPTSPAAGWNDSPDDPARMTFRPPFLIEPRQPYLEGRSNRQI
jgi:hypothetical protein